MNQPLRIRAYLQTGVISDQFLPLDAVLYYHAVRDKFGEQHFSLSGRSTVREYGFVDLPFEKKGDFPRLWFYACSFAQWPQKMIEDKTFYVKQTRVHYTDLIDFRGKRGKIQTKRGEYKSYHVNVYYRHCLYVDWYANGEKEEIINLLRFCTHIGKKTAQGWGSVKKWEVTEWPEDWSIHNSSGELMRAIPSQGSGFLYGIRPSYWNSKHQFNCIMP